MDAFQRQSELKKKIRAGRPVLGTFIKTPAMHIVEVLARIDFDFIVLDSEHAPFSISDLDKCLLAARANRLPALVRVPDLSATTILRALDMGAAGIFVPHIKSAAIAGKAIAAARYQPGDRGYSASHRAGAYGAIPAKQYIAASDESTIIIGQIEDVEAVENIDEIAGIDGLDALFIGPADLMASYGREDWVDTVIEEAINKVCDSARRAGRAVGMYQQDLDKVAAYRDKGISLFTISTDQSLLVDAARIIYEGFKTACK